MNIPIHICFASDDNYAPYMGLAMLSILMNADKKDKFHFYILDNKISTLNKEKITSLKKVHDFEITWLPLNAKLFEQCDTKKTNWTLSIFGRYLIPQLIAADKVLYLDCDVMIRQSLADLWNTDINEYYVAGVLDLNVIYRGKIEQRFKGQLNPQEYVNSGVLLINNKKWREENIFQTLLDYSVEHKDILWWPDQDAINFICRSAKKILPMRYNIMGAAYKPDLFLNRADRQNIQQECRQAVIRHFHPRKKNFFIPYREEYLTIMEKSPWKALTPQDDPYWLGMGKCIMKYFWRHPFCFLLPKFYKRWYYRGTRCMFIDY